MTTFPLGARVWVTTEQRKGIVIVDAGQSATVCYDSREGVQGAGAQQNVLGQNMRLLFEVGRRVTHKHSGKEGMVRGNDGVVDEQKVIVLRDGQLDAEEMRAEDLQQIIEFSVELRPGSDEATKALVAQMKV